MSTVRLKNKYRTNTTPGSLVRVDPNDHNAFVYVDVNDIDTIGVISDIARPGNFATIKLIGHQDTGGLLGETFETVSKNLKNYPYSIMYDGDDIDFITYDLGNGLSVKKTFNYILGVLTSIVLSGDVPDDIDLTKTFSYTGDDLTSVSYS